ncbi:YodC family protein [Variovorax boronicumulans]
MANKYNVGDVVGLKSDGPDMTVRQVPEKPKGSYGCQWFAGKKLESGIFPEDSLEPRDPKRKP